MRVHFNGLTFDSDAREMWRGGDRVHLSPKAFRLLEALIDARPAALSKEQLFEIVWPGTFVAESNLASLIKEIRTALQDDARQPKVIRTVFRHGYAFAAEATVERAPQGRIESIAVFPFTNAGGPEWDYVSDGVAEGLLNALARLPALRVVPRSTSFRYRSPEVDLRTAARELHVEAVVTGRLAVRDDTLTIQAELVDAKTDAQIWGERFHARPTELLHVQKQIESEITTRIAERSGIVKRAPASPDDEAYHHFLFGQHQLNRRDAEGFRRAIQAFRTAAEIAPSFALAHATLAEAYVALGSRDLYPPAEIFPLAREAATRAIELDPSIPAAHTALAAVQELFDWDWDRTEASHRTAVGLEPHATAAQWFALHYTRRGLHGEAEQWIRRALALEPLSPIINTNAAFVAYLAHDYAAAVRGCDTALELTPHFEAAHVVRGVAYIQIDPQRAVCELEEAARLSSRQPFTLAHLASAHAAAGDAESARRVHDELVSANAGGYVSSALFAVSEVAVGNRAGALDALERAAGQRSPWISYLLSEPRLDMLRDEARFRVLVAAIGFGPL